MTDLAEKLTKFLSDELAKQKSALLVCTTDKLLNIQVSARYLQSMLDMIGKASKNPEREISFDD